MTEAAWTFRDFQTSFAPRSSNSGSLRVAITEWAVNHIPALIGVPDRETMSAEEVSEQRWPKPQGSGRAPSGSPRKTKHKLDNDGQFKRTDNLRPIRTMVRVGELAQLVSDRFDPKRLPGREFDYIELAHIADRLGMLWSRPVPISEAPERARKQVRVGDVLVSTVRRERARVGVVPRELDGAICTTAFAVLRPNANVNPYLLAFLLQSRIVSSQLERLFTGTAYVAFHERQIPAIRLPTKLVTDRELALLAKKYMKLSQEFGSIYREFSTAFRSKACQDLTPPR